MKQTATHEHTRFDRELTMPLPSLSYAIVCHSKLLNAYKKKLIHTELTMHDTRLTIDK